MRLQMQMFGIRLLVLEHEAALASAAHPPPRTRKTYAYDRPGFDPRSGATAEEDFAFEHLAMTLSHAQAAR
jgi:hypothetical protein